LSLTLALFPVRQSWTFGLLNHANRLTAAAQQRIPLHIPLQATNSAAMRLSPGGSGYAPFIMLRALLLRGRGEAR
jgi:hypothetical protein